MVKMKRKILNEQLMDTHSKGRDSIGSAKMKSYPKLCYLLLNIACILLKSRVTYGGRIFDETEIPVETVVTEAGANLTLACPGVTEHSLVSVLEWYCVGCSIGDARQFSSSNKEMKLVELRRESTTVWQNHARVSLNGETHALNFHPVVAGDTGEYRCLVNDRRFPESILKLVVQAVPDPPGRPLIVSFTSRAVNLSWAPPRDNHNSRITHYVIHTRVGEDGDWNSMDGIITENNMTTYQVEGLQPFTVNSFRVLAVNALGRSPPSKQSYYIVTLREVPDGKPTFTAAQNASSTSIKLAWRPPKRSSLHGEFLGYRLAYRPRDKGPDFIQEICIKDPTIDSFTVTGLLTFTQYLVSLQVFNPEGLGPPTTIAVITDEGVPEKPTNLTVLWVTDSMMELSWYAPEKPNGKLEGYRIFYAQNNFTDVVTVKKTAAHMKHALNGLEPYTEYKIWVKAFTWKNEGVSSEPILVKTDVKGPGPPQLVNVSCKSEDALYIVWKRPNKIYNSIDFYYIEFKYKNDEWADFEEITETALTEQNEQAFLLLNLTTNMMYEVRVRGGTRSVLEQGKVFKGQYSDSRQIYMQPDCEKVRIFNLRQSHNEFTPTLVAVGVVFSFLVLLISVFFIVWRRCFKRVYYYLDDPPRLAHSGDAGWEGELNGEDHSIPAHLFPKHVKDLHADSDDGFSKEFESFQSAQDKYASKHSNHPENKQKNRYMNIVAYDHSRVHLQPLPGQKKGIDYVNANYIDGFKKPRAYIGTQGPLPSTFESFWRMVWEHNVQIIVMITNLVERGRKKCDMYWPKEGSQTYGVITVTLVKEDVKATYTIRTFVIRHLNYSNLVCDTQLKRKKPPLCERTVYHYHYTNWPDHGTPSHPLPVLSFVKKSSAANPCDAGPIIVHCSAGVGRTGTYIVLDTMLRQIKARGDINIFGFLTHIRTQRNFLVQTEDQYIFTHDALLEAIECGETNIRRELLPRYVHSLLTTAFYDEKTGTSSSLFDSQYKLVTKYVPREDEQSAALRAFNLAKNRNLDCVCIDGYRVCITPKPGVDGSDYINASFFPGYNKLQEYVVTQHPLENTIPEFWQMLWDHNVQRTLLLTPADNEEYPAFWPSENSHFEFNNIRVKLTNQTDKVTYLSLDFTIQSLLDDYELSVRLYYVPGWRLDCEAQSDYSRVFDLVHLVQDSTKDISCGPIVVVDRFGGSDACTFCCLYTLSRQMDEENCADLYMYAKMYHEQRPGVFNNSNDYLFLYHCLETFCVTGNGGVLTAASSPSPMLPPIGVETFMDKTILCHPPNGHIINGGMMHNGNGNVRIPPEGVEAIANHQDI